MELSFRSGLSVGLVAGWIIWSLVDIFYWRRYAIHAVRQQLKNFNWRIDETALNEALAHQKTLSAYVHRTANDALDILQAQLIVDDGLPSSIRWEEERDVFAEYFATDASIIQKRMEKE